MTSLTQPPPIQWLPVFAACARHLSFKKAARELHVSPPAVSQQIKALENYLGKALFQRHNQGLQLTAEGELYSEFALRISEEHQRGFQEFNRRFCSTQLRLSAPLFLAQELLIPHYLSFNQFVANTELRLSTGVEYVDFATEPVDMALRFGQGPWPDLHCEILCDTLITPVCSPAYLQQMQRQTTDPNTASWSFAHLYEQRLISYSDTGAEWRLLLPDLQPKQLIVCDSYFSVVKSAQEGLGMALGILPVINRLLNDGSLLAPMPQRLDLNYHYWLVAPKHRSQDPLWQRTYAWAQHLFQALPERVE